MNGKQLAQHIGNIDEALVEEAREVPNYALRRQKTVLRRAVSLAAVLVLMLCSGAVGAVAFRQETEVRQETVELTELGLTLILPEDFARVRALGNPVSDIVAQWLEFFYKFHRSIGYAGAPMHDPCAVMALIHPEIFTIRPMYVQVETGGEYCRGTTVGDLLGFSGHAPNADVLMDVDRSRFADLLVEAIGFYGEAKA